MTLFHYRSKLNDDHPATRRQVVRLFGLWLAAVASAFASPAPCVFAAENELRIGLSSPNFGAMAALGTADQAGLFRAQGLAPTFVTMENGATAMAALLAGSVQLTVSGPAEVIAARARGQNVVLIANLYRGLSGSLVLSTTAASLRVGADSPVRDRLRALDGMIVAVPSATSSLLHPIRAASEAAGAKIRFTYMGQATMPAALETGSIQGFVASSPVWMTPVFKGTGIVWVDGPKGELPPDVLPLISGVLSTTEDFAKNSPTVIDRVHRTLKSLAGLVATNPEQAKASFAKVYPSLDQRTIDEAFAREAPNFTKMELSAQDIHHEIGILKAQGSTLQNLSDFRPKTILYSR